MNVKTGRIILSAQRCKCYSRSRPIVLRSSVTLSCQGSLLAKPTVTNKVKKQRNNDMMINNRVVHGLG